MKEYLINRNDTFPVPNMHIGMTLRDYFAAKAMQAELMGGVHEDDFDWTVRRAYKMADAMMNARGETK
jgi:hypothetical protein